MSSFWQAATNRNPNRQTSFHLTAGAQEKYDPAGEAAGTPGAGGAVPDPNTSPAQKVGMSAGDFHPQLPEALTLGRYGPDQSANIDPGKAAESTNMFGRDFQNNNC